MISGTGGRRESALVNMRRTSNVNSSSSNTGLEWVFGYPPWDLDRRTNEMIKNSMPTAIFLPQKPKFQGGLTYFSLEDAWGDYTSLLASHGFSIDGPPGVKVAFLADNFPTDTFNNEYGENFLQKFTDVASEGAATISQMFGARNATEAVSNITGALTSSKNALARGFGGGLQAATELGNVMKEALVQALPKGAQGAATGAGSILNRMMAGNRIDFPMVWKSSSFQPSYSLTIRLFNPNPRSAASTHKYIVGPIVAILLLGLPQTEDGNTFSWPYLHKIIAPGLFDLTPGFISNITVVKGGDQQQISFQQNLGIVDVRIDIGSLYSTLLASKMGLSLYRPSVRKYASIISGLHSREVLTREQINALGGPAQFDPQISYELEKQSGPQARKTTRQIAPRATQTGKTPPNRVSPEATDTYNELIAV